MKKVLLLASLAAMFSVSDGLASGGPSAKVNHYETLLGWAAWRPVRHAASFALVSYFLSNFKLTDNMYGNFTIAAVGMAGAEFTHLFLNYFKTDSAKIDKDHPTFKDVILDRPEPYIFSQYALTVLGYIGGLQLPYIAKASKWVGDKLLAIGGSKITKYNLVAPVAGWGIGELVHQAKNYKK